MSYSIYTTVIWVLLYYNVNVEAYWVLGLFLVMDTLLWIGKSYVLDREQEKWFSSNKLKVWALGKITIMILCLMLAIAIKTVWVVLGIDNIFSWIIVLNVFIWLLISAEFISIIQNSLMIIKRKKIQERDALTAVITWLLFIVKTAIRKKIEHDDEPVVEEYKTPPVL